MSFLGMPPNINQLRDKGETGKIIEALKYRLEASPKGAPVRVDAAKALGEMRVVAALPTLVEVAQLDSPAQDVRNECVRAIVRIGGGPAINAAIELLPSTDHTRENARFRDTIIRALVHIGPHAIEKLITAAVETENPFTQTAAAEALVRIGDVRCIRPLILIVETTASQDVYHHISDSLYRFENPAAIPEFIITMHEHAHGNNPHLPYSVNVARTALERMTKVMFGDDARDWARWWDEEGEAKFMSGGAG